MRVAHLEKNLLLTPLWLPSFFLCCPQTSPAGDDEKVVKSSRPWETRVWPVIQWPPGSSVATHCTTKLGPWPSTHGPWSVQPTTMKPLMIVDTVLFVKFFQLNKSHKTFLFECKIYIIFQQKHKIWILLWSYPASHHIKLGSNRSENNLILVTATILISLFSIMMNDCDFSTICFQLDGDIDFILAPAVGSLTTASTGTSQGPSTSTIPGTHGRQS